MKKLGKDAVIMVFVAVLGIGGGILGSQVISVSAADFALIKPEELKKLIDSKKADFVVVDTQPKGVYDMGHIKGAISFPWEMELKNPGKLPKDKTLILYCDCGHEEDSMDVANQLKKKWSYTNLKILEGGWSKWQELGHPIDKK
jgi:rhodanese-related sulfurtransferase